MKYRKRCNKTLTHYSLPALSLILLGVLAACSDSGIKNSGTNASGAESEPTAVGTSLSAAHLASDNTATVQTALSRENDTVTRTPEPVRAPAAATPDESTQSQAVQTSPDTSTPDNATPDSSGTTSGTDEQANESIAQTSFTSVSAEGFEGEVLDDSIRIRWHENPGARGFNVFRRGAYLTTVFTNEFIDSDVYDGDYYYEVQAFDQDDNYTDLLTGLTVSARTLGRTDPNAAQPIENLLENYELVFSEEFTGMELDTSKWETSFIWGTDLFINNEEQFYVDVKNDPDFGFNPFSFDGENMTISTIETPAELAEKAVNQPYLSGIITSYESFKFTYGYAEVRAKLPHGRGYWPAFWLLNAYYGGAEPEIDIMEFIGQDQDTMYHTYHYFDSNGELRSTPSHPVSGIDFTADFHTFGVEWKPGTLIFNVDGIETKRISDANVSQQEMYVLANTAVGGWWAGSPDFTTPLPGRYIIDYIRVYQSTVPHDDVQFDQPNDLIPLFSDDPGQTTPNHKPPFHLWPNGYPGR